MKNSRIRLEEKNTKHASLMNQQSLEDLLAFIELRNITLAAQRTIINEK